MANTQTNRLSKYSKKEKLSKSTENSSEIRGGNGGDKRRHNPHPQPSSSGDANITCQETYVILRFLNGTRDLQLAICAGYSASDAAGHACRSWLFAAECDLDRLVIRHDKLKESRNLNFPQRCTRIQNDAKSFKKCFRHLLLEVPADPYATTGLDGEKAETRYLRRPIHNSDPRDLMCYMQRQF